MQEYVLAWASFAVLLLLSLPFAGTRKLVLEVYAWLVRLALLALLAGGAYLAWSPGQVPAEVVRFVDDHPRLGAVLPAPGTPTFGLAVAALAGVVLLPVLAVLDVTRKLAGDRLLALRRLTDPGEPAAAVAPAAGPPAAEPRRPDLPATVAGHGHAPKRPDRRTAAETMAELGTRKPYRVSDNLPE